MGYRLLGISPHRDQPERPETLKYGIFFLGIFTYVAHTIATGANPWRWLLVWPAITVLTLAAGYLLNKPGFVLGKRDDGRVSKWLFVVNLPWLVFLYALWYVSIALSREDVINRVGDSNIYLSRRPLVGDLEEDFDVIVDLTAEFVEDKKRGQRYFHLPWLDGVAPSEFRMPDGLTKETKVLVHCAQGHGRTATYASILMTKLGLTASPIEAYEKILRYRPHAKMSKQQKRFIESYGQ
ncbi:MAG: hypothetical protein OEZ54_10650 [Gemmatimonadota bacterium]|nr:hypothetical protein [Gemmatimonadota bacterium]